MRYVMAVLLLAGSVGAENLFVDLNNSEGFTSIGEALRRADEGDVVFVSEGVYFENLEIDKNISLIGAGAGVTSIFAQTGIAISVTGTDSTALIEGMTITSKDAVGINVEGGGITIRDCEFTNNTGAVPVRLANTASVVRRNVFTDNFGAIALVTDLGSVVSNNIIKNNNGGAVDPSYLGGNGVIYVSSGLPETIIANNIIKDNTKADGILCALGTPTIKNNTIVGQVDASSANRAGWGAGAGIAAAQSNPLITSNIIVGNRVGIRGNGVPGITYNLVADNVEADYNNYTSDLGEVDDDPLFTDPRNDDYTLQDGSPAIDAGLPGALHFDPDGTTNDIGAYGGPLAAFWQLPYVGPVITNLELSPTQVQQGGTVTVRASATTVRDGE